MLAQFHARYPSGCLVSDLLTIYQGQYIVRAAVQVEGVTRSTGLGAATSLEGAEDQARARALAVLDLETVRVSPTASTAVREVPAPSTPTQSHIPSARPTPVVKPRPEVIKTPSPTLPQSSSPAPLPLPLPAPPPAIIPSPSPPPLPIIPDSELDSDDWLEADYGLEESSQSKGFEDWTELPQEVPGPSDWLTESPENLMIKDESVNLPTDLSEEITQIKLCLEQLGWKENQEKEYLKQNYGKLSRDLLADEELIEYLNCLNILIKTEAEMKRLQWDKEKGRDFLEKNYGITTRLHLSPEHLQDFLERLEQL